MGSDLSGLLVYIRVRPMGSDILALFDRRGSRLVAVRRRLAALPPSSRAAARPLALGQSVRGTIAVESRFRRSVRLGGRGDNSGDRLLLGPALGRRDVDPRLRLWLCRWPCLWLWL